MNKQDNDAYNNGILLEKEAQFKKANLLMKISCIMSPTKRFWEKLMADGRYGQPGRRKGYLPAF